MFLKLTDDKEIHSLIKKLQIEKSGGDDQISSSALKTHSAILTPAIIHNNSILLRVPDKPNIAKVIPINKRMEEVIHKRVTDFLKSMKWFTAINLGSDQGTRPTNQL